MDTRQGVAYGRSRDVSLSHTKNESNTTGISTVSMVGLVQDLASS